MCERAASALSLYVRMYSHTNTCINAHDLNTHTYPRTHAHICTQHAQPSQACAHTHTHARACSHSMHTRILSLSLALSNTHTHTQTHTQTHTHTHTHTHTRTHTHTHVHCSYAHTYTAHREGHSRVCRCTLCLVKHRKHVRDRAKCHGSVQTMQKSAQPKPVHYLCIHARASQFQGKSEVGTRS